MEAAVVAATDDLRQELEKLSSELVATAPAEVVAAFAEATEELVRSELVAQTLRPGERAPEFTLPDSTGRPSRLTDFLARGPLVLTFYRGVW